MRMAGAETEARALAERAQQIAEQVTTPPGKVDFWGEQAYFAIAETHLAAGDVERAEQTMRGRLQAWERSGAQRSIARPPVSWPAAPRLAETGPRRADARPQRRGGRG